MHYYARGENCVFRNGMTGTIIQSILFASPMHAFVLLVLLQQEKEKKGNLINHNVQLFRFERNWDWHLSSSYTHMMKILHSLPPMIRITRSWYNARYEPFNCFHILNFIFDDEIMQFGHKCILFPIRKYKMFATVTDDDYPRNNQFPFF